MSADGRKALVTGGCGFMGPPLCERLVDEGYEVRATDLEEEYDGGYGDEVEFVPSDLTDPESLDEAVEGIDVVFHTAAVFSYSSLIDWESFEEVNVDGTENLCEAAVDEGVGSVVVWSTAGVYGDPVEERLPITEDHPKRPESKYDRSKWIQEQKAMEYRKEGLTVKALRPSPVYGPGNTYGIAQLWFGIARGLLRVYPSRSDYKLPLVHVDDVVCAGVHVDQEGDDGEAYNVVDDQGYEMRDVIRYAAELAGRRIYPAPVGNRTLRSLKYLSAAVPFVERLYDVFDEQPPVEKDALFYLNGNFWLDNSKLKETGFELTYPSYEDGLPETFDWYEENGYL